MRLSRILGGVLLAAASAAVFVSLGSSAPLSSTTVVHVIAGKPAEFAFTVSKKSVKAGTVRFLVTNNGSLGHTFKICSSSKGGKANACAGKVTKLIDPKKSATLTAKLTKGTHEYLCTVPGHAAGGMKGDLKVT